MQIARDLRNGKSVLRILFERVFEKRLAVRLLFDTAAFRKQTAVDLQKPQEIKKNKPKTRGFDPNDPVDGEQEPVDELWDQYQQDPFFRNPAADRNRIR